MMESDFLRQFSIQAWNILLKNWTQNFVDVELTVNFSLWRNKINSCGSTCSDSHCNHDSNRIFLHDIFPPTFRPAISSKLIVDFSLAIAVCHIDPALINRHDPFPFPMVNHFQEAGTLGHTLTSHLCRQVMGPVLFSHQSTQVFRDNVINSFFWDIELLRNLSLAEWVWSVDEIFDVLNERLSSHRWLVLGPQSLCRLSLSFVLPILFLDSPVH